MAAGYAGKENPTLESTVDIHVQNRVSLIRSKYVFDPDRPFNPMDLARKAQFFTFDVITEIGFGESTGDLVADEGLHGHVKTMQDSLMLVGVAVATGLFRFLQIPWVSNMLFRDDDKTGPGKLIGDCKR